ncbi:MAG TPA: adenylate/guanylate cyclase domain-containing protein [Steroidobacteraceae bacterium]|jgi:pimeloyl-ACP methyl ester carboxylesterase|nr:adenylate/guanylate cyclase domain-containing protein [Steroidobacteraceae bacterium]
MRHVTKYAKSGDVHIAYQVVGDGPIDLVLVHGWISHIEHQWEDPAQVRFLERLASFSRLITFDKRGTGLSDRVPENALPTIEQRMDDVRAVMDAAGCSRAAVFGISEGGPMSAVFAATYPERTAALVMYGTYAKWVRDADYPWAPTREEHETAIATYQKGWGTAVGIKIFAPSVADDAQSRQWWARHQRLSASPSAGAALYRMNMEIDVRDVLPTIRVPTLLIHRAQDRVTHAGGARYIASQVPGAKYVEQPGGDHIPWIGDGDAVVAEVQEFLTGARPAADVDRVLATVMFVDIVGSTERAAALGDARWKDVLGRFHDYAHRETERFRGRVIDTAGDGVFASFDGPARAIRCANAIRDAVATLGLKVRAGLHTGECEVAGDKVTGIAVHIGARVASSAEPGETLVTGTVKDLVAGSGLRFADRGLHALKGVSGDWRLFAVQTTGRQT